MNEPHIQFDEATRNSADFQYYDRSLKYQYTNYTYLKSIDSTLKSINDKLTGVLFILLLPIILAIICIIISILAGISSFNFLSNFL